MGSYFVNDSIYIYEKPPTLKPKPLNPKPSNTHIDVDVNPTQTLVGARSPDSEKSHLEPW